MIKKVLFAACLLASMLPTFAQKEAGIFTIQPKVGLNIANIYGGTAVAGVQKKVRVGLAAGLEMEYQFTPYFSLAFGALYSQQGARGKATVSGIVLNETDKVDYINLPIMANVYLAKCFALKFGVQPEFKINDGYKITGNGTSLSGSLSDLGYRMNSFNFSIPVGFSLEFSNVTFDARYNIGVTKIEKDSEEKNGVFQFTLGYKFKVK